MADGLGGETAAASALEIPGDDSPSGTEYAFVYRSPTTRVLRGSRFDWVVCASPDVASVTAVTAFRPDS